MSPGASYDPTEVIVFVGCGVGWGGGGGGLEERVCLFVCLGVGEFLGDGGGGLGVGGGIRVWWEGGQHVVVWGGGGVWG